jgi:hypothetical protein
MFPARYELTFSLQMLGVSNNSCIDVVPVARPGNLFYTRNENLFLWGYLHPLAESPFVAVFAFRHGNTSYLTALLSFSVHRLISYRHGN